MDDGQTDPMRAETDEQAEARMMRALSMMSGGATSSPGAPRPNQGRHASTHQSSTHQSSMHQSSGRQNPNGKDGRSTMFASQPARSEAGGAASHLSSSRPAGARRPAAGSGSAANGSSRRHRFVQDGEVPVVNVARPRRDAAGALSALRAPDAERPAGDDVAAQAAQAERAARLDAERRLAELAVLLRSHQTRLGDAEMARDAAESELRELRAALQALQTENANLAVAAARREPAPNAGRRRGRAPDAATDPDADTDNDAETDGAGSKPVKWWI